MKTLNLVLMFLTVLTLTANAAEDFDSVEPAPTPQRIYKDFNGRYHEHWILAAHASEYSDSSDQQLAALYQARADAICVKFGFLGSSQNRVGVWEGGRDAVFETLEDGNFTEVYTSPEVSNWSFASLGLIPIWTDQRVFESITCYKNSETHDSSDSQPPKS